MKKLIVVLIAALVLVLAGPATSAQANHYPRACVGIGYCEATAAACQFWLTDPFINFATHHETRGSQSCWGPEYLKNTLRVTLQKQVPVRSPAGRIVTYAVTVNTVRRTTSHRRNGISFGLACDSHTKTYYRVKLSGTVWLTDGSSARGKDYTEWVALDCWVASRVY